MARTRPAARAILALLLLLGQLPCAPRRSLPPAGALVALDGDTLQLPDGQRVRLPGVDTPESGRPWSRAATAFSRRFVADGVAGWELVPADPRRDRYGRLLADVRVDGRSLSAALVEQGLAWVYGDQQAGLLGRQGAAIDARRGLYAGLDRSAPGPFVASARRFHHLDCPLRPDVSQQFEARATRLLAQGLSPCRTCLAWPPASDSWPPF